MNWKLYVLLGFLLLAAGSGAVYTLRQAGELAAKLERAEADKKAMIENQATVTKALERSAKELKKVKEERNAAKDRIARVANPTGCLDVDLSNTAFGIELRRAYGGVSPP